MCPEGKGIPDMSCLGVACWCAVAGTREFRVVMVGADVGGRKAIHRRRRDVARSKLYAMKNEPPPVGLV